VNWQTTDDGQLLCPEHGKTFGPLGYCPSCDAGGGTEAANDKPGRAQAEADQSLCRTVRDEILTVARSYADERDENDSKDRIGWSTVAKLYDCALKWHRAAMEERLKRDDENFAAWIMEEKRRLLNRGASH
jgi:uncharacterized Zn finger protein (UPF0148 family)